ncbi:hypothetical protein GGR58DRAFT_498084 [Xylaria digitata]|nr:hypothetical protein GGR58DRAFT_498084 [Xylaria digitata]
MPIWPHNEYGWSTINPAWLTFSCLHVPDEGLAAALKKQAPDFIEKLLRKGVKYVYRYDVKEVKSNTGTSVFDAYGQHIRPGDDSDTIRRKIEEEVKRHSSRFKWHEDGSISVTHVVPVIRRHEETDLTTCFGNLTSAWGRTRHHKATEPPYLGDDGSYHPPPEYGDGTPIEKEYLNLALSIAEESQVLVAWQKGDMVLLDVSRNLDNAENFASYADELLLDVFRSPDMKQSSEATQSRIVELTSMKDRISSLGRETRDILVRLDSVSWKALQTNTSLCTRLEVSFGWRLAELEVFRTCRHHRGDASSTELGYFS